MDIIVKKEEDENFYCDDSDHPIAYCENNILNGKTNASNVVTLRVDSNAMCIKEEPCTEDSEFRIEYLHTEVKEELPVKSEDIEIKPEEIGESTVTDCEKEKNHNLITNKRKKDGPTVLRCTLCQYTTTNRQAHWQHQDTHKDATDRMYYKCHHCDHRTTQKTALKFHLLTHMDPTKVTWYKCTLCPYASKLKGGLKVHMLTHKNISEVASDTKRTVEVTQQVKLQQKIKRTFSKLIESETECDDDILVPVENIDGKDISTIDYTVCDFTENKSVQNKNDKNVSTIDKAACDFADILLRKNRKEENRRRRRLTRCKFCNKDILATNFSRHVQRCHAAEDEIKNILCYPKKSKQRKVAFLLLRNDTNFNLYKNGVTRPNRQRSNESNKDKKNYHPCVRCKGLYIKQYLRRHSQICTIKMKNVFQNRKDDVDNPQTAVPARESSARSVTSKLNMFSSSECRKTALKVTKDALISHFGESYLEKQKEIVAYACDNRMKELNRLLTTYQRTSGNNKASLKDLLLPSKFSTIVSTVNKLAGYNPLKKTFRTPNLVDNLENSLKQACKELIRLIEEESDGFETHSVVVKEKWLKDVKNFISLVNTRWKAELDSLTNKEPQRRICTRSLKLSLVANIETFEDKSLTIAVGEVPTPDKRKQPLTNMTGKIVKRRWTNKDVERLNKEFGRYIKKGVYPSGKEIEVFIKKYKVNRNIDVVKSKIQHIINLNNKRKLMKHS